MPLEARRFVKTETVRNTTVQTFITGTGRVSAGQKVALIAEVQGRLLQGDVMLKTGQSFRKGLRLYTVDSREASYSLSAQKSQFLNALAAILPDVKIDYPQHFDMIHAYFASISTDRDLPPLFDLRDSKLRTFLASKNVLNQYYSIKSAEERLRKYTYHAPFDGTFSSVLLEAGSVVNPGAVIAYIINTGSYELEMPVASDQIAWVSPGQHVRLSNQDSGRNWSGRVTRISEHVDPNTQSVSVYVALAGSSPGIYDGMYLTAFIPGPQVKDAMEIPRRALFDANKVYIVEDGMLKSKIVEVKKYNMETVVIGGLADGWQVVVESVVNAHDNMPVQVTTQEKEE